MSRSEAAAFRQQWLGGEIKTIKERYEFTSSWSRVDITKGVYKTFGRAVQDLGGFDWPEAKKGAATAMAKCMLLGSPWVITHPQTEMQEFLILEMSFKEQFSEAWSHFKDGMKPKKAANDNKKPKAGAEKPNEKPTFDVLDGKAAEGWEPIVWHCH